MTLGSNRGCSCSPPPTPIPELDGSFRLESISPLPLALLSSLMVLRPKFRSSPLDVLRLISRGAAVLGTFLSFPSFFSFFLLLLTPHSRLLEEEDEEEDEEEEEEGVLWLEDEKDVDEEEVLVNGSTRSTGFKYGMSEVCTNFIPRMNPAKHHQEQKRQKRTREC